MLAFRDSLRPTVIFLQRVIVRRTTWVKPVGEITRKVVLQFTFTMPSGVNTAVWPKVRNLHASGRAVRETWHRVFSEGRGLEGVRRTRSNMEAGATRYCFSLDQTWERSNRFSGNVVGRAEGEDDRTQVLSEAVGMHNQSLSRRPDLWALW